MPATDFVSIEIDPGPAAEEGLSLRFKRAGDSRAVTAVPWESDDGLHGVWDVHATDSPVGVSTGSALATPVEDSSEGTVWLVAGGLHGLVLTHPDTHTRACVPYLLLAMHTALTFSPG